VISPAAPVHGTPDCAPRGSNNRQFSTDFLKGNRDAAGMLAGATF
jgi:hypothetical protein